MAMIAGGVAFYMTVIDSADKDIRHLGGIKNLSFLKSDIEQTTKRTILGQNSECPASTRNEIKKKFLDFHTSSQQATYKWSVTDKQLKNSKTTTCFFHPARFAIDIKEFHIEITRTSEPNFLQNASIVTVNTRITTQLGKTRNQQKYLSRYKISVKSLEEFGLVADTSNNLFNIDQGAKVVINGETLIDQSNRQSPFPLDKLITTDHSQIRYGSPVHVAAPSIVVGENGQNFLAKNPLTNIFAHGINLDTLPINTKAPYQHTSSNKWADVFDYSNIEDFYPLPLLESGTSIVGTNSHGMLRKYGEDYKTKKAFNPKNIHNDTKSIYSTIYGTGGEKMLYKSCTESDIESGKFNLLIFNNFNEDFTIDFSENKTGSDPAVFCGLIAARSVTVYLSGDDNFNNQFIGKIFVKNGIKVRNKGILRIHDLVSVSNEQILDSSVKSIINLANLKLQYYNQKYFSSQNFALPFFNDASTYSSTDPKLLFYVPRATKDFFKQTCDLPVPDSTLKCRQAEINSPNMKALTSDLGDKLVYDVRILE